MHRVGVGGLRDIIDEESVYPREYLCCEPDVDWCITVQLRLSYSGELHNVPKGVSGLPFAALPRRAAPAGGEQGAVRESAPAAFQR